MARFGWLDGITGHYGGLFYWVNMAKAKQKSTVIERAKKFFDRVVAYEAEQRKAEIDDIRFVGLLDQWPANI